MTLTRLWLQEGYKEMQVDFNLAKNIFRSKILFLILL